jgi:type II secretory pathway component PulK
MIITLVTLAILTTLVVGFIYERHIEFNMVKNQTDELKTLYAARSGLNIFIAFSRSKLKYQATMKKLNIADDDWFSKIFDTAFPVGESLVKIEIKNNGDKININLLKSANGNIFRPRVDQLLNLCDLINEKHEKPIVSWGIVPAIIDWTDADDEIQYLDFILTGDNKGAEDSYYANLSPPYQCRNGSFNILSELLLVKDITPRVYKELSPYLTVYGRGKININTASKLILQTLNKDIDDVLAEEIIEYRRNEKFKKIEDIKLCGIDKKVYNRIKDLISVEEENYFWITSTATKGRIQKKIKAVVRKTDKEIKVEYIRER